MSRHEHLLAQMTLAEKASLMSGANFWNTKPIERLGVPSIMLTDGPHGLRKQGGAADHLGLNASIPATCFPTAASLANSWDTALLHRVGEALGVEAAAEHVQVLLGPGLNIKRNPLAGRNFEYFSEDPVLAGSLAAAMIRGIQSQGVAASAKHFAVNSQETHRMTIDEIVDERALHELYLEGFRIAITQGDAWTVMSAYNKVNGTYANESQELLQEILRRRWAFDGLVVTDWGGNNDRVAGLRAGNALEMPTTSGVTDREIVAAVEAGTLDSSILNDRVAEVLTLIDRTRSASAPPANHDLHHALAIDAARRSIVLAANPTGVLPLGPTSGRVAVIGDFAERPRYQGAGSSLVRPTRISTPLDALRETELDLIGFEPGFHRRDLASRRLRTRALRLAQRADVVLLFLGLDESSEAEGVDRTHMRLANNQLQLTQELIELGVPIVVVLSGGSPVELPFADDVSAVLLAYLAGQGSGVAIAEVLTGAVSPGGRLAETYPLQYADVPSAANFARNEATSEHRDSIYIGYRYYDKVGAPVRYPFGHGLSFTQFAYSDLQAGARSARVTVENTGNRRSTETVQLYVEAPGSGVGEFRAPRELAGFAKLELAPGERGTVEIEYSEHAFQMFDIAVSDWHVAPGVYSVLVGSSSRDIRLRSPIEVAGVAFPVGDAAVPSPYLSGDVGTVTTAEFASLLGRALPSPDWPRGRPLTRDDIVAQTRGRGGFASLLFNLINASHGLLMMLGRPLAANNTRFLLDLPFRSVARMSAGAVNDDMLDGILLMVNGRFFRGVRHVMSARRAHRRSGSEAHASRTKAEDS